MLSSKRVVFVERMNHRKSGKDRVGKYGRRPKKVSSEKKERKRYGNPHRDSRKNKLFLINSLEKSLNCDLKEIFVDENSEDIFDERFCSNCDNKKYYFIDKQFICIFCGEKNYSYWTQCQDECLDCGGRICQHNFCPCGKVVCSQEEMEKEHSDCCKHCGCSIKEHYVCDFCDVNVCSNEYHYCYEEDDYYAYFDEREYLRDMEDWARQNYQDNW